MYLTYDEVMKNKESKYKNYKLVPVSDQSLGFKLKSSRGLSRPAIHELGARDQVFIPDEETFELKGIYTINSIKRRFIGAMEGVNLDTQLTLSVRDIVITDQDKPLEMDQFRTAGTVFISIASPLDQQSIPVQPPSRKAVNPQSMFGSPKRIDNEKGETPIHNDFKSSDCLSISMQPQIPSKRSSKDTMCELNSGSLDHLAQLIKTPEILKLSDLLTAAKIAPTNQAVDVLIDSLNLENSSRLYDTLINYCSRTEVSFNEHLTDFLSQCGEDLLSWALWKMYSGNKMEKESLRKVMTSEESPLSGLLANTLPDYGHYCERLNEENRLTAYLLFMAMRSLLRLCYNSYGEEYKKGYDLMIEILEALIMTCSDKSEERRLSLIAKISLEYFPENKISSLAVEKLGQAVLLATIAGKGSSSTPLVEILKSRIQMINGFKSAAQPLDALAFNREFRCEKIMYLTYDEVMKNKESKYNNYKLVPASNQSLGFKLKSSRGLSRPAIHELGARDQVFIPDEETFELKGIYTINSIKRRFIGAMEGVNLDTQLTLSVRDIVITDQDKPLEMDQFRTAGTVFISIDSPLDQQSIPVQPPSRKAVNPQSMFGPPKRIDDEMDSSTSLKPHQDEPK